MGVGVAVETTPAGLAPSGSRGSRRAWVWEGWALEFLPGSPLPGPQRVTRSSAGGCAGRAEGRLGASGTPPPKRRCRGHLGPSAPAPAELGRPCPLRGGDWQRRGRDAAVKAVGGTQIESGYRRDGSGGRLERKAERLTEAAREEGRGREGGREEEGGGTRREGREPAAEPGGCEARPGMQAGASVQSRGWSCSRLGAPGPGEGRGG